MITNPNKIPEVRATPSMGPRRGCCILIAFSVSNQPIQAWTAASVAKATKRSDAANLKFGSIGTSNASRATPVAVKASEVLIHERNVRSFAKLNLGSGSVPLE